jgi:asparagine synthase (glutamine-hydrolysing)
MCGICGVIYSDHERPVDRPTLARMTNIMQHRGPDSFGFHVELGVGLGVCRLSIIDLKTGDQPISNENGTVTVICNGEIYNFLEIRQELIAAGHRFHTSSDVEVVVHLYEDLGPECVHRLRGMFGFALWDSHHRLLMLARDRLGIKPLYYAVGQEGLCFGSEIKPILTSGRVKPQLDVLALRDLFTFGFIMGPKTLFSGVSQLLPGHYLLYRDGNVSMQRYWQVSFPLRGQKIRKVSLEDWAEALLEKLEESVRIHLRSDVPFAAWLSGGIDSSSIVGLMSKLAAQPIQTYSLTFGDSKFDEVSGQKTLDSFPEYELTNHKVLCRTEDFELFPNAIWSCENISASGIEILQMILSESTTQSFKVVVTGEGSDEVFGGYGWFQVDKLLRPLAMLPLFLRRLMLLGPLLPRLWPGASRVHLAPKEMNLTRYQNMMGPRHPELMEKLFSADLKRQIVETESSDPPFKPPPDFRDWHPFTQLQYYELTVRLPNFITHLLDRTSMAYSLEARVPFLDHEFVEFCAKIPPALKMKKLQEKYILRQAVRELLPRQVVWRKKRGLRAPYQEWLCKRLPDFATEMLSDTNLSRKGYFNPQAVYDLLKRHRAGESDYGAQLLGILGIQLWDEFFTNGEVKGLTPQIGKKNGFDLRERRKHSNFHGGSKR